MRHYVITFERYFTERSVIALWPYT